jgi:predicted nucleic acid-binding protein
MMPVSRLFVDTNILVYYTNTVSTFNQVAVNALETARQQGKELIISPQILREYLATTTRLSLAGNGPSLSEIIQNFHNIQNDFTLVRDELSILTNLINLVQNIRMGGKQVHDANIVATMQAYGITHLLTHNTADFARFAHLITVVPLQPGMP